jgi:hypothetical protein
LFWALIFAGPTSIRLKAAWAAARIPAYLTGTLEAADQARRQGIDTISVIEFGVASGRGLLTLEKHAEAVEKETGVHISVYGFDTGKGLPKLIGDHRDHPDAWLPGDFPMDEAALRSRLGKRTSLIIGDVAETVPRFLEEGAYPPIGFAAIDLDIYSSTVAALKLFSSPKRRTLHRTILYFDDIMGVTYSSFAGERLAINEFNATNEAVKIDQWYGVEAEHPFPELFWLKQLFIAHDLEAIGKSAPPPRPVHRL